MSTFGLSNTTGYTDLSGSLRVISGTNADLPEPVASANVTASAGGQQVTIDDTAGLPDGAELYIYDDTGQYLGSGGDNGSGGAVVTLQAPSTRGRRSTWSCTEPA